MNLLKTTYWRMLALPGQITYRLKTFFEPSGTGDWIFATPVVKWTYDPNLRRQLPWPHRLFAVYASFFEKSKGQKILGGDHVFSLMSRLHRFFSLEPGIPLKIGEYTIFLNPYDPRMLQVPNELTNPQLDALKLRAFLASGDTFIDVGANHGSFSLVASRLVGPSGRIVAVEPQPLLSRLIKQSLQATAPCPYVVHEFACSDHEGQAVFFVPHGSSGSAGLISTYSAREQHQTFSVALKRFDEAVDWRALPGRLFVKLDVEGSEMAFLKGAQEMLAARHPPVMMEVHPTSMEKAGVGLEEFIRFFLDRGYSYFIELNRMDERRPLQELSSTYRNVVICAEC